VKKKGVNKKPPQHVSSFASDTTNLSGRLRWGFLSIAPPWSDHMVPWERFLETRIKPLGLFFFKRNMGRIFHVGVMDEI